MPAANVKHAPATALPLKVARNVRNTKDEHARIDDANGMPVATVLSRKWAEHGWQDAEKFTAYTVSAANAYPRLVEALRVFVAKYDSAPDGPLGVGLVNGDFIKARALLREIGEIE